MAPKPKLAALLLLLVAVAASVSVSVSGEYKAEEVIGKSPTDILALRGFLSEVHQAPTADGYFVNLVRIVNPKLRRGPTKRPVIFNHGLMESATVWLVNSRNVRPLDLSGLARPPQNSLAFNGTFYLNGPMMLSNFGYDVWLMSMRGTEYALLHTRLSPSQPRFWDYCLDDFALSDVPSAIQYVRRLTRRPKVGYVGHSQATFTVFALLSERPEFARLVEPVVAVAPVAYFDHISSIARLLFKTVLRNTDDQVQGHFPPLAGKIRAFLSSICDRDMAPLMDRLCAKLELLVSGPGEKLPKGFYSHLPFYTSLKVLRHFGQLIESKRFQHYDYGPLANLNRYGTSVAPAYLIQNIRSRALFLIRTRSDALSPPMDVVRFKRQLTVPLYKDIYIDRDFDHFDLIAHEDSRHLVFKPILEAFEDFERNSGRLSLG